MSSFRTLDAWKTAMDLVDAVYDALENFPKSELFALSAQLRKAVTSIPSLIAEGRGRSTDADQRHFYVQARGSTHEVETQLEIAVRRRFIENGRGHELIAQTQEVCKCINGLIRSIDRSPSAERRAPSAD